VDADGSYFQASLFAGSQDFDPGPGEDVLTAVGDSEIWVSKFSADGAYLWTHAFGRDGNVTIAAGADGSVLVSGDFTRPLPSDPNAYLAEPFIARLDASGALLWQHVFETIGDQGGGSATVASDDAGNAIVAAVFAGNVDFDPAARVDARHFAEAGQGYLFQYGSDGSRIWERPIANEDCGFRPERLAVTAEAIVAAGVAQVGCILDGKRVGSARPVLRFNRIGAPRDVRMLGARNISGLLAFDDGSVILSGRFTSQLLLDDVVVASESSSGSDFILRLSTDPTPQWIKTTPGFLGESIARAPEGGVVASTALQAQAALGRALVVWRANGTIRSTFRLGCNARPFLGSNADSFLIASDAVSGCDPDPGPGVANTGAGSFVARYRF
jgi:hypothetical protein